MATVRCVHYGTFTGGVFLQRLPGERFPVCVLRVPYGARHAVHEAHEVVLPIADVVAELVAEDYAPPVERPEVHVERIDDAVAFFHYDDGTRLLVAGAAVDSRLNAVQPGWVRGNVRGAGKIDICAAFGPDIVKLAEIG